MIWIFKSKKSREWFGIADVPMIMLICLYCAVSHLPSAFAQDNLPDVWTGPEAVQFALKNNPDAQIAIKRIASSVAAIKEANATFYPQSVSYTHLTLPTILLVQISVVAVSLKKKIKNNRVNRISIKNPHHSNYQSQRLVI
eukprot:TRINITY_DN39601_c0_g1_i1.p1 TRINITY_DN39601_c0_g1~~TRINITY_DN39601_c0_g1_i1.p1  ORF type:complete len:141 (-),score=24.16 TRINITY_DN39601_c0_g1_i1:32-454(-)